MDSAMRRLRLSVHGQSTSAGRLEVPPVAWAAFDHAVTSAWPQRSSHSTERGAEPPPPANPGRSAQPAPEVRE
jgi:hypothetical protein